MRDEMGLTPGATVEITSRDGCIAIEPVARKFAVVKRGPFAVVEAPSGIGKLTQAQVKQTIRRIRERRG
jgi:Holliday junction resolvasome RuvABC endonuclease subunit